MNRRMIGVAYVVLLLTAACGARLDKGVRSQLANAALHPSAAGAQLGGGKERLNCYYGTPAGTGSAAPYWTHTDPGAVTCEFA